MVPTHVRLSQHETCPTLCSICKNPFYKFSQAGIVSAKYFNLTLHVKEIVMCDISKKYRFRDNFVDIIIVSIFDTALADFDIY